MHNKQTQKGFTLVELLIYIAIVAMVLTTMTVFATTMLRTRAKNVVVSEVQYNAWLIHHQLSDAIRRSEEVNTGTSTFGVDPGVLSLSMVSGAEDPTIFSLDADDGSLQVNVAGGGNTLITTDRVSVTDFTFTDLTSTEDVGIILIEYSLSYNHDSGNPYFDYVQDFQTTLRVPLD